MSLPNNGNHLCDHHSHDSENTEDALRRDLQFNESNHHIHDVSGSYGFICKSLLHFGVSAECVPDH